MTDLRACTSVRRPRRRGTPLLSLLLLLALAVTPAVAPAAVAQDAPDPGPDVFGEVIEVRVVNVEVVVTDGDGNRVIGLGPDDFRLYVDGEETPIEYFSQVVGGAAVEMEAPAEGATPAVRGIPAAVPGEPVGTSYLLFIDDYWSIARDRNALLQSVADDLSFLAPGDRMAIVAFDGKGVDMLTSWTDSERQLRRALSDAQARPALGLQRLSELRSHDRSLFDDRDARSGDTILNLPIEDRVFANEVAAKLERSVGAVVASLRGFAQPPGRKVMLLLSGGWPFSPAAYAVGSRQVIEAGQVPSGDQILEPLVDTANLVGYTVYPVDVPGLSLSSGSDVEQGGRLATGRVTPGGTRFGSDPEERFNDLSTTVLIDRESNIEDTLRFVARETGGEALINAAGIDALATVAQDTRSYYWLGFTPDRRRDDERHEIRVEVTRPGLEVRTRENFLDMSRDTERTMAVESALLFGDPAAEGSLVVEVGEPTDSRRRTMEVPILVAIPTDLVTAIPEGDEWIVRLELRVAALDESNRQSEVPSVPLELAFPQRPEAGKLIPYRTQLTLRRTEQVLVVSVTDVLGDRSFTARVEVAP